MAEVVGLVSAGVGLASFSLQVSDKLRALRRIKDVDMELLSGRLEVLQGMLASLEPFEEHPAVSAMIRPLQQLYSLAESELENLLAKFPKGIADGKRRVKMLKLALYNQVEKKLQIIRGYINELISMLDLVVSMCVLRDTSVSRGAAAMAPSANRTSGYCSSPTDPAPRPFPPPKNPTNFKK